MSAKKSSKKTTKQPEKKVTTKKATTKTASAQQAKAAPSNLVDDARAEAVGHQEAGRWAEAAEAWTRVANTASTRVERIKATGYAAAAKVRATAKATSLDEALANNPTAATNAASWDNALPEPGYVEPADEGEGEEAEGEGQAEDDEDDEDGQDDDEDTGEANASLASPAPDGQKPPATPRPRDPRLPPVGTVIIKQDRHGAERARCTVMDAGIEYNGTAYKSLSAAAMAAAKDLNLGGTTQDGFAFWKLKKPSARAAAAKDPVDWLGKAWDRYRERAASSVKIGEADEARAKVRDTIQQHLDELNQIAAQLT